MKDDKRVNLFSGWSREAQRKLIRDVNNVTPGKFSFKQLMKELNK